MNVQSEDDDYLDYLITVDIFSEGTDIVEVNQVIMLRPTQSPIVFIQQLGRGLRKAEGKEYVVILDFIGNYKNNEINILNKNAKYSIDSGKSFFKCTYKKDIANRTLLKTGADKSFSKLNIYDIAGNVWEWTLELTSYPGTNRPCARRGGGFYDTGSSLPAAYRSDGGTVGSVGIIGFRVSLF